MVEIILEYDAIPTLEEKAVITSHLTSISLYIYR